VGALVHSFEVPRDLIIARWSSGLLGATVMAFSLFAYFFSMVTGFVAIMGILIGLGDSQMRTTPLPHYPVVSTTETTPAPSRATVAEQDNPKEPQKAQEDVKKIARAKMARERNRMALARLRLNARSAKMRWHWDTPISRSTPQYSPRSANTARTEINPALGKTYAA
jgi:hypothetical protein